jgi:hypothetical protein
MPTMNITDKGGERLGGTHYRSLAETDVLPGNHHNGGSTRYSGAPEHSTLLLLLSLSPLLLLLFSSSYSRSREPTISLGHLEIVFMINQTAV